MKAMQMQQARGFTLIEILVAFAILAVLGAVAVIGYGEYTTRAGAADLISRHHDIRTAVIANAATRSADNCAGLVKGYDGGKLADPFATLSYGFEKVGNDGFRPVLIVCATAERGSGVKVAQRAHDSLTSQGLVEKGAVLTDTIVSYALRLTPADQALCKTAPARSAGDACATAQPQAAAAQAPAAQPVAPALVALNLPSVQAALKAPPAPNCTADQDLVTTGSGPSRTQQCVARCSAGQTRYSDNPACVPAPDLTGVSTPPEPTSCPAGQEFVNVAATQGGTTDKVCAPVCAAGTQRNPNNLLTCVPTTRVCTWGPQPPAPVSTVDLSKNDPCKDIYTGGDCAYDFDGLCDRPEVAELCSRTCGACQPDPVRYPRASAAGPAQPTNTPPPCVTDGMRAGSATFAPWVADAATPATVATLAQQFRSATFHLDEARLLRLVGAVSPDGASQLRVTAVESPDQAFRIGRVIPAWGGGFSLSAGAQASPGLHPIVLTIDNGRGTQRVVVNYEIQ